MKNQQAVELNGGNVLQPKHPIGPHDCRVIVLDSEANRIVATRVLDERIEMPDGAVVEIAI